MKLDRNTNKDGRGKYALINLRTDQINWGGQGRDQFFVMKYRDKFTAAGLRGYAEAVRKEIHRMLDLHMDKPEYPGRIPLDIRELIEYAEEIEREASTASSWGNKIPD